MLRIEDVTLPNWPNYDKAISQSTNRDFNIDVVFSTPGLILLFCTAFALRSNCDLPNQTVILKFVS